MNTHKKYYENYYKKCKEKEAQNMEENLELKTVTKYLKENFVPIVKYNYSLD